LIEQIIEGITIDNANLDKFSQVLRGDGDIVSLFQEITDLKISQINTKLYKSGLVSNLNE